MSSGNNQEVLGVVSGNQGALTTPSSSTLSQSLDQEQEQEQEDVRSTCVHDGNSLSDVAVTPQNQPEMNQSLQQPPLGNPPSYSEAVQGQHSLQSSEGTFINYTLNISPGATVQIGNRNIARTGSVGNTDVSTSKEPSSDVKNLMEADSQSHDESQSMTSEISMEHEDNDYLMELQPAFMETNCIICLPTGKIKIQAAVKIAKEHLKGTTSSEEETTKSRKILFVVNQNDHLDEVYVTLKNEISSCEVVGLSSTSTFSKAAHRNTSACDKVPLQSIMKSCDILVITGGNLCNRLGKNESLLSKFSLVIFDECHHTMKDHPYNKIMSHYFTIKAGQTASAQNENPQIVGLTISPGAGSKNNHLPLKCHILTLCANLDAQKLLKVDDVKNKQETFQENKSENYEKKFIVADSRNLDPFKALITEIMERIENLDKVCLNEDSVKHGTQQYENLMSEKRKKATLNRQDNIAQQCEHLLMYNSALLMNDVCKMSDSLKTIDGFYRDREATRKNKGSLTEKQLYKLYRQKNSELFDYSEDEDKYPNQKVTELRKTLKKEMENNGDEFRGIVFVKSQNVARAVHRMLQEDEHLQNLKRILSLGAEQEEQNDDITDASVTAIQEPNIMKEFSAGFHKLIVTTGGIETKLGTSCKCNTIVWYGHVDNVISTKQTAELLISGESIVYFIGDQATSMRADVNTLLDQEVDRAIQEIHSMSEEEYDMEISKIQKENLKKDFTKNLLNIKREIPTQQM
ncbi:interferon-induced helicase C domain-containing protein 1-like [Ptychodera flava]|uniref:interferon-induced helicase C domain-containing protein 1-like n=1 Tax=Ptychodera flava TaxID=63121 RepID=UPI003969E9E9